jgi:hypothetical protein
VRLDVVHEVGDFPGGFRASFGQFADFLCDDGKAQPVLPGTRRFDGVWLFSRWSVVLRVSEFSQLTTSSFSSRTSISSLSDASLARWLITSSPSITWMERISGSEMYLAFNPQTSDALIAQLQAALREMREDGTVDDIYAKYR